MSINIADDYASLRAPTFDHPTFVAYYGYEVTDDEGAWCFQAKFGETTVTYTQDDLTLESQFACEIGLLKGIELLIVQGYLVPSGGH